jgi:hypothetical protein
VARQERQEAQQLHLVAPLHGLGGPEAVSCKLLSRGDSKGQAPGGKLGQGTRLCCVGRGRVAGVKGEV